jgi:collagenase-like PrtC family protease
MLLPRKPELLAPAGDQAALEAAVLNGADAVYLGVREFNARVSARNFSLEDLGQALKDSHNQGVRVYLTLNTLVKNRELARFFAVLGRAYALGIDGVIIQHLSFLEIIKRHYQGLPVFMSTQASLGNLASAERVREADRVILPRELTIDQVKAFVAAGHRVEVFVHGALCFGWSGQCLFSSFVASRSGNRGACAQLCRQEFNGVYPLSTRELCLARRVPELVEAGISGFKVEGRMRSPLYVAVATRLYRRAIDAFYDGKGPLPEEALGEIEVVFNRRFTEGFMFGDRKLLAAEKPMNRGALLGTVEGGKVKLERAVAVGDGIGVWGEKGITGGVVREITLDGKRVGSGAAGQVVALGLPGMPDGTRIYLTSASAIRVEPGFTVRRPRVVPPPRPAVNWAPSPVAARRAEKDEILVRVYSRLEAEQAARAGADAVFYDVFATDFPPAEDWKEAARLGAYLPRILGDDELRLAMARLRALRPAAVLAANLGFLEYRRAFAGPVYLDYALNDFNDLDTAFFRRFEAVPVVSPELTMAELEQLRDKDVAVFIHGDPVLLNTLIPLKEGKLVGDQGLAFPVRKEAGYWQILNSRPLGLFNDVRKLGALGFRRFYIDRAGQGARWAEVYRRMLKEEVPDRRLRKGHTSGHFYRPVG